MMAGQAYDGERYQVSGRPGAWVVMDLEEMRRVTCGEVAAWKWDMPTGRRSEPLALPTRGAAALVATRMNRGGN